MPRLRTDTRLLEGPFVPQVVGGVRFWVAYLQMAMLANQPDFRYSMRVVRCDQKGDRYPDGYVMVMHDKTYHLGMASSWADRASLGDTLLNRDYLIGEFMRRRNGQAARNLRGLPCRG